MFKSIIFYSIVKAQEYIKYNNFYFHHRYSELNPIFIKCNVLHVLHLKMFWKSFFFFNVSMEFKETLYMLKWIEIFNVIINDFLHLKSLREMNTVQLVFFCGHSQYNSVMCRVNSSWGLYNTFIKVVHINFTTCTLYHQNYRFLKLTTREIQNCL